MLILSSVDPYGITYVETANLDGETNLKLKRAHDKTANMIGNDVDKALINLTRAQGELECELPNKSLYTFEGTLELTVDKQNCRIPLEEKQVLLRGSRIRSTAWALGLVIFTGKQTKIQMNSAGKSPRKISEVERLMARLTYVIGLVMVFLCAIAATWNTAFATSDTAKQLTHLGLFDATGESENPVLIWCKKMGTFVLIFSNFIPISLIVTVGLVKLGQVIFIYKDNNMVYKGQRASPRTTDLNEELGQVQYVFTDKTGTLTCNVMEFRKLCVAGQVFGEGITEIRRNVLRREGKPIPVEPEHPAGAKKTTNVNVIDPRLAEALKSPEHPKNKALSRFFLSLGMNNAVVPEIDEKGVMTYSASSPDEGALTYGAKHFGFGLSYRDPQGVELTLADDSKLRVEVLVTLDFTSRRKRSSVIVQYKDPFSGQTKLELHTKGADTVVWPRLSAQSRSDPAVQESFEHMGVFAEDGLRTLCIGMREIGQQEFDEWHERYKQASMSMEKRQAKIEAVAEEVEQDLCLVGITGIEDRLQDGVPETIETLINAHVAVWMLTGDKVETAINIGIAAGMLSPKPPEGSRPVLDWGEIKVDDSLTAGNLPTSELLKLAEDMLSKVKSQEQNSSRSSGRGSRRVSLKDEPENWTAVLEKRIQDLQTAVNNCDTTAVEVLSPKMQADIEAFLKRKAVVQCLKEYASGVQNGESIIEEFVIDGGCLAIALEPQCSELFVQICRQCRTVICCRVSPEQKGSVVRLVRKVEKKAVTLAIGDGANDCNMIRSANVGIGLKGEEGLQAYNVCDYGIHQFRFLGTLLLCHGRWNYRRLSYLILYMFYKNVVIVMPQYYANMTSHFSGQKLYHDALYQTYNLFFTSLPIMAFGLYDQDMPRADCFKYPQIYILGQQNYHLNVPVFLQWCFNGAWHAAVIFVLAWFTFGDATVPTPDGQASDLWMFGSIEFFLIVLVVNLKMLVFSEYVTWLLFLTIWLMWIAWVMMQGLLSFKLGFSYECYGQFTRMMSTPLFPIVALMTPIIALTFDVQHKAYSNVYKPVIEALTYAGTRKGGGNLNRILVAPSRVEPVSS
jgi:magnesium-transporting ATPase (P-type)